MSVPYAPLPRRVGLQREGLSPRRSRSGRSSLSRGARPGVKTVGGADTDARGVKKALLPQVRMHDLRHTHATLALQADIHPKVVSERLGHASIGITLDMYSHVMPGMQEEAAEKIDAGLRAALAGT